MRNNPNLDPINIIEYAKFGLILFVLKILSRNKQNDNQGP